MQYTFLRLFQPLLITQHRQQRIPIRFTAAQCLRTLKNQRPEMFLKPLLACSITLLLHAEQRHEQVDQVVHIVQSDQPLFQQLRILCFKKTCADTPRHELE